MDDMYNAELKQRFIDERAEVVVLPNGYLSRWFRKTEEFESINRKDVSNFTFYEILDMYKTFSLNSIEALQVLNSQLSAYTQWCLQQNLVFDSQNHFLEFKKDIFDSCINHAIIKKKIVSRKQVLEWARQLKNPCDSFIFLALFEGIRGQQYCELAFLRISDFHDGKVKLNTGREIQVSEDLYNLALEANETLQYYGVSNDLTYKLNPEDLIIKNYPNVKDATDEVQAGVRISHKIKRNAKFLGIEHFLTSNALRESGKIDFVKKRSKKLGITAQEYVQQYKDEIEYQFDCRIPSAIAYYNKYKEYLD